MGYCQNCGTYNSDKTPYCVNCKAPLFGGRFGNRIGGFLAFITYGMIIGSILFGIYSIVFVVQVFKLAAWLGGVLRVFAFLYIIVAISMIIWFVQTSMMILDKDPEFLRTYQKGLIINSVLLLIMVIWGYSKFGGELGVSLIMDVIYFFVGGLVYSIYFSTSERVFEYMNGSDKYLRCSLFNQSSTRFYGRSMDVMSGTGMLSRITNEAEIKDILDHGGWKCEKCGAVNKAYIGTCSCGVDRAESDHLKEKRVQDTNDLIRARQEREQKQASKNDINPLTAADAIAKYKQLLDLGAITPQEYENKKKELLSSVSTDETSAATSSAGTQEKATGTTTAGSQTAGSASKGTPKPVKAEDTMDWNCKKCGTLNKGDVQCCRHCGGIKKIVGYTPVASTGNTAQKSQQTQHVAQSQNIQVKQQTQQQAQQEPQYTQHTDANGNTYYMDSQGNAFYVDENGNAVYINQKGYPYYLDPEGRPYYHDMNGYLVYYDQNGDPYYPANQ